MSSGWEQETGAGDRSRGQGTGSRGREQETGAGHRGQGQMKSGIGGGGGGGRGQDLRVEGAVLALEQPLVDPDLGAVLVRDAAALVLLQVDVVLRGELVNVDLEVGVPGVEQLESRGCSQGDSRRVALRNGSRSLPDGCDGVPGHRRHCVWAQGRHG